MRVLYMYCNHGGQKSVRSSGVGVVTGSCELSSVSAES